MTTAAFGSGFALFEHGAKAVAMGGAFAATADDPSAIFYNVAGIAQLRRTELTFGGTAINFQNSFTGDPNDLFTAGMTGSKYRAHTFIVPNAYATMPIGSNMTVGVGLFAPFGLRTNWAQPWPGRQLKPSTLSRPDVSIVTRWPRRRRNLLNSYERVPVVLARVPKY